MNLRRLATHINDLTLRQLGGATPVADEMSEVHRLYQVWSTYQAQVVWRDAVEHGADVAVAAQALIGLPEVSALEALDANRRLVDVLLRLRRDAVSAARQNGSSWAAIGAVLGTSKQRAYNPVSPHDLPLNLPSGAGTAFARGV